MKSYSQAGPTAGLFFAWMRTLLLPGNENLWSLGKGEPPF